MQTDLELMQKHVRALFTHDAHSRLLFVNEPDAAQAQASRLFLGRTRAGNVRRFRADLPQNLCDELEALCADELPFGDSLDEPPRHFKSYVRLLEKHAPVETFGAKHQRSDRVCRIRFRCGASLARIVSASVTSSSTNEAAMFSA